MDVTVHGVRYREALDTTDRREAASLEKKRVAEIEQGKAASPAGREFGRLAFKDAGDNFIRDRVGHVAERTTQFEKERLAPMKVFFGEKPLRRIRAEDIKAYQKHRLDAGRSGKTINMEVGVLRLMMKREDVEFSFPGCKDVPEAAQNFRKGTHARGERAPIQGRGQP
jgi:hypothetical protein